MDGVFCAEKKRSIAALPEEFPASASSVPIVAIPAEMARGIRSP